MTSDKTHSAHKLAGLGYLLYGLGILFGITALIGVIINHTKLQQTRGTYSSSHIIWQIIAFWTLFGSIVLALLFFPTKVAATACLIWWAGSGLIGVFFLIRKQPIPFITTSTGTPI